MTALSSAQVLEYIPQKSPFRFIDELLQIDPDGAIGRYTFKPDEFFYRGHFPEWPVTPGVILVEAMCQTGLVALGIYLLGLEDPAALGKLVTLFTDAQVEFDKSVFPGDTIRIEARKVFWRRKKLRSEVTVTLPDGTIAAKGIVSGMGVLR